MYRLTFLISLVLHGLVLFLPLPERSPSPDQSPQPQETITLTELLASPNPSLRTVPPQSPPSIPATPKVSQPTPQPEAIAPSPQALETPIPSPTPTSTPTPTPSSQPSPTPTPTVTPTPEAASTDTVQTFFEQLAVTTGVPVQPPSPDLFPNPNLYFDGVEAPTLRPGILRAVWIDGKTPEQVYVSVLTSQLQSGNFQTEQKPDYGGGTVYEIEQGNTIWYLNLVPTVDGNGTVIVVWNRSPE